jgi:hypothetical protein
MEIVDFYAVKELCPVRHCCCLRGGERLLPEYALCRMIATEPPHLLPSRALVLMLKCLTVVWKVKPA